MLSTALPCPATLGGFEAQDLAIYVGAVIALTGVVIFVVARLREMPHDARAKRNPTLDPMQLEELMQGTPPILIDLRPPEEFKGRMGHLRGALNIPMAQLAERLDEARATTGNRPVVLVDRDDRLSHQAVPLLMREGFGWVYVLKGGMAAWKAAGLPVYR